jgi:predicted N-acetyltransferase YhbS
MEYLIRAMRPDDVGSVTALLMRAFFDPTTDASLLHGDFVRLYFDEPAAVIRVAEQDNRLLGIVFGHCWGSVGWLGPVAVSPNARRSGIGRALVEQVTRELERRGCTAIVVDSEREERILAPFYARARFRSMWETVSLVKRLETISAQPSDWVNPDVHAAAFAEGVHELGRSVANGIELLPLIEWWRARAWGDGLLLRYQGEPVALAVMMYRPRFAGESAGVVRLAALLLSSSWSVRQVCSLLAAAVRARHPSARYLYVRDNAADEAAWREEGWSSHGYGRRWALQGLSPAPIGALLCLE